MAAVAVAGAASHNDQKQAQDIDRLVGNTLRVCLHTAGLHPVNTRSLSLTHILPRTHARTHTHKHTHTEGMQMSTQVILFVTALRRDKMYVM